MNKYIKGIMAGFGVWGLVFALVAVTSAQPPAGLSNNGGSTLVVDDNGAECPDPDHTNIQDAVDDASDGDTVEVCAGTYQEQVVINKDLSLIGNGQPTILASDTPETYTFDESGSSWQPVVFAFGGVLDGFDNVSGPETVNVNISGFDIDGNDRVPDGRSAGILLRNVVSSGSVSDNEIFNMSVDGRETFGIIAYGDSDLHIRNNNVSGYARGGIGVNGDGGDAPDPTAIIKDNVVTGPGRDEDVTWAPNGIQIGFGATGQIRDNEVSANGWPGDKWSGSGILVFESSDVQIMNNTVNNNESAIGVQTWCWFVEEPVTNNQIVGNSIEGADFGISVAAYVLGFGISSCDPTASNNGIVNNSVEEPSGDGDIGIFVGTGFFFDGELTEFTPVADNNKVIRNSVSGFDTEIEDSGTNTKNQANVFGP